MTGSAEDARVEVHESEGDAERTGDAERDGEADPPRARTTVLLVASSKSAAVDLAERLSGVRRFDVRPTADPADLRDPADDVDCVVIAGAPDSSGDSELRGTIRTSADAAPVVVFSDGGHPSGNVRPDDVAGRDDEWTAAVDARSEDDAVERLRDRIDRLVARRRARSTARRDLTGVDPASDGIAVVDSDGRIASANGTHARLFDAAVETMVGTPWQRWFDDATVARLETAGSPAVADGWRWMGAGTGRRIDGDPVRLPLRLVGLADGRVALVTAAE